jgi:nitrate reductase molybdenum cofactor assembly chaperone
MTQATVAPRVLDLLADILDYPQGHPDEKVEECASLVSVGTPEAAAHLRRFQSSVRGLPAGRLEEIYTVTFDLEASCHPYVGYHLFGESYQRSTFLVGLKERYRAWGFESPETELPDRLSVMLRFLAVTGDEELKQEIMSQGLLPALGKMIKVAEDTDKDSEEAPGETPDEVPDEEPDVHADAYRLVLRALRVVLEDVTPRESEA